jgi:hypothetical protein
VRGKSYGADVAGLQHIRGYSSAALIGIVSVIFAAGIAAVFGVLFPVLLSDTVSITDEPTLRTAVKDSLDLQEAVSSSISVADEFALSDSAEVTASIFHQVTATSILGISDSVSPDTPILETVNIHDRAEIPVAVKDLFSLLDSVARLLTLYITDSIMISDTLETQVQENEDEEVDEENGRYVGGGGGRGPDRTVYDESHFRERPLSRMETTNIDLVDSQDRVLTRVISGQEIAISVAVQNHQNVDQGYTLFVQITDKDNVAMAIIPAYGVMKDGAAVKVDLPWTSSSPGSYVIQVMVCDGNPNPAIISETVSKTFVVG